MLLYTLSDTSTSCPDSKRPKRTAWEAAIPEEKASALTPPLQIRHRPLKKVSCRVANAGVSVAKRPVAIVSSSVGGREVKRGGHVATSIVSFWKGAYVGELRVEGVGAREEFGHFPHSDGLAAP